MTGNIPKAVQEEWDKNQVDSARRVDMHNGVRDHTDDSVHFLKCEEYRDSENLKNNTAGKRGMLYKISKALKKVLGVKPVSSFEESVSELIREHHTDASVHEEEKTILQNIVTFGDLEADDIMVTRVDIVAVPETIRFEELRDLFIKHSHSRILVYRGSLDNVIGFVHLKDLFRSAFSETPFSIKDVLRQLIYVPASIKITDLLSRMKHSSVHIAIILDEYGGTDGLVTIEDIIRKVLGEIRDEYMTEQVEDELIKVEEDGALIDAKARFDEVSKVLKLNFSTNNAEYDTFGGFVITFLGRIPQKGEAISHPSGLDIEIVEADNRKVKLIKVKRRP